MVIFQNRVRLQSGQSVTLGPFWDTSIYWCIADGNGCCEKPWDSVGHRGEWATSSSQLWFSSCGINQVKKSTKLTVYGLGSETVCPEKNRQTAFNSPLFCPISPHLYLIDDQCACIFSENWPGPIHAISSYQRTIGCFILLVPLQQSASHWLPVSKFWHLDLLGGPG